MAELAEAVEAAEQKIDSHHKNLTMATMPIELALWGYLSLIDMYTILNSDPLASPHQQRALGDLTINAMKWALRWIHEDCKPGGKLNKADVTTAAVEFHRLAVEYLHFETAYVLARMDIAKLSINDTALEMQYLSGYNFQHRAYELMEDAKVHEKSISHIDSVSKKLPSLNIQSGRLINPRNINIVKAVLWRAAEATFVLPDSWDFSILKLSDFREIFVCLQAIVTLNFLQNKRELSQTNSPQFLYRNILFLIELEDLVTMLHRYSGIDRKTIQGICEILTYGNFEQNNPDPALQPLIKVNNHQYALSYTLLTGSNFERNLVVLMNRNAQTRKEYLKFNQFREDQQLKKIKTATTLPSYSGPAPGDAELPDIDLAIIDHENKCILLCELKSFIHPAEPREVVEKTQEIQKGVGQASRLLEFYKANQAPLLAAIKLNGHFDVMAIVVADNFVGEVVSEAEGIPVVMTSHLVRLLSEKSLAELIGILRSGSYLPIEGRDFNVGRSEAEVGGIHLSWDGVTLTDIS